MSAATNRGGAAIGRISDLNPVEAGAVLYLRLWSDGAPGRAEMARDFAIALGADGGRSALAILDQIFGLCALHGRRPLIRHGSGCVCLGADENCFAQMIAAAAEGEHDDALMMALLIVRPDLAPALVALSEQFGLMLRRMAGRCAAPAVVH
ncbi:hypothetical protein FGK63_03175 [Ruegeria sediminis]|uniref:Uncharacterized protein n=1 Tax=Ruegeria sediminis TaxID=2583820 RepID=A0ABY2X4P9_9RHOB|nr:hypothetical protein [Ruegeria sediminis]TMV10078.1 hypothetical protein FGK63_03175 [Ruegeria sediminis]